MKKLAPLYALLLLIFIPLDAAAQKEEEVYRASNMTVKMEVFLGKYDPEKGRHIVSPPIEFNSFKSWFGFSAKIDEMDSAPLEADTSSFLTEVLVLEKE